MASSDSCSESFALFVSFVVLTFDFFSRFEDCVEKRANPGADEPWLASTRFLVYFVFFVVQTLSVIGLWAKPVPVPSWLSERWSFALRSCHHR